MFKQIIIFIALFAGVLLMSCNNDSKQNEPENSATTENSTLDNRGCDSIITETPYDIPAQQFDVTAQQLAHASGCFIETDLSKTGEIQVNAVKGKISIREAVQMAIENTELEITEEESNRLVIEVSE